MPRHEFGRDKRAARDAGPVWGLSLRHLPIVEFEVHPNKKERRHKPAISAFDGILVPMFWSDHGPPHFRALYAEHEGLIDLQTPAILEGGMPRRALALILERAQEQRAELIEVWELCAKSRAGTPRTAPHLRLPHTPCGARHDRT